MKIEIRGLKKRFGDLVVFDGLDLTIEEGELTIIMGRSGTGKSVLLKHLVGLIKPDEGEILVDGIDVTKLTERELNPIRKRFGMIFQNAGMLQSLSVGENVALPDLETKGMRMEQTLSKVAEKLKMVGLEGRENQPVSTLSGGQRKRVAVARALLQEAEAMLFDEPTAGLDPPMSQTVDDIIERMNAETGATMVVVTHDLVSAFNIGEKLHLLHKGKIVASGTPEQMLNSQVPEVREFLARETSITEKRESRTANPKLTTQ